MAEATAHGQVRREVNFLLLRPPKLVFGAASRHISASEGCGCGFFYRSAGQRAEGTTEAPTKKGLDETQKRTMWTGHRARQTFETGFGGQPLRRYSVRGYSVTVNPKAAKTPLVETLTQEEKGQLAVNPKPAKTQKISTTYLTGEEKEERWFAAGFAPM
ncbi:MAG: hypothetical protein ABII22_06910 [Candidatus Micrarchaeota archaeon]